MLKNQFSFGANAVTVTQVVANLGAMTGGTVVGYLSQSFGRRLSIICICVVGGALLYPYTFVTTERVIAAAFFEQFCVQGAWGVIPIHLMELSPGAFRTFVVGTSYQLGNLVSSASSTIEATTGERFPLSPLVANGKSTPRYNYGKVICIFMGCVYAYVILLTVSPFAASHVFVFGPLHQSVANNNISSFSDLSTCVANSKSSTMPMYARSRTRRPLNKSFTAGKEWVWVLAMKTWPTQPRSDAWSRRKERRGRTAARSKVSVTQIVLVASGLRFLDNRVEKGSVSYSFQACHSPDCV